MRVGYASPKLIATLAKPARRHLLNHVIWASTSNPFYSVRGVHPGASLASAVKALHPHGPFHLGRNFWYLATHGRSAAVLKVRNGIVQEIGIGDKKLLHGREADIAFLKNFD